MRYEETQAWQIDREKHPALTVFWVATSVERGRGVTLYELNCMFCERPLVNNFKGDIIQITNYPMDLDDFEQSLTVRCKRCKQHWRFVVANHLQG